MTVAFETADMTVHLGDALEVLRAMPAASVDCVVTSPPYFGLRDYGVEGQIGLEAEPDAFVAKLVAVFAEVRRVLRDHGTLWLNMGDSYANDARWGGSGDGRPDVSADRATARPNFPRNRRYTGLKAKDMLGMPWRVAFALQADGWYLRSDIIWAKPNPMPESVTDRPTKAHEYVFLMAKSERYFYDADAIRSPFSQSTIDRLAQRTFDDQQGGPKDYGPDSNRSARKIIENLHDKQSGHGRRHAGFNDRFDAMAPGQDHGGANARTVWSIPTEAYPDAHFATFPQELPRRAIKAGTSEYGNCAECGAPYVRVVEASGGLIGESWHNHEADLERGMRGGDDGHNRAAAAYRKDYRRTERGWKATCGHTGPTVAAVVLDPFAGSGTTLAVARELGRSSVGIELNPDYIKLIEARCVQLALL